MPIDLSWSNLARRDLTGADLRYANFEHCNLRGTVLGPGTTAWNANFSSADMYKADLHGAELPDANFTNADLYEANLRQANLRCVNLAEARGALRQEQLAGADITGAALPEQLNKLLGSLDNVKNISESARKLFIVVLAACLYSWLTIATSTDLNLITNRISSPLPIIQTAIPIVGFYVVAPLLLLCTYLYFHFYLQKLWEELGSLPAILQDGRPLHAKVDPWLLNDLVRSHLSLLNVNRPFLSYLQLWLSVLLAWWLVPLTLFLFWGRYIRKHDPVVTALHIVVLSFSLLAAFFLYRLAVATLRGRAREPFRWKQVLKSRRGYMGAIAGSVVLALLTLVSLGAIRGNPSFSPLLIHNFQAKGFHLGPDALDRRTWVPRFASFIGYSVFADLSNSDISIKKTSWTRLNAKDGDMVEGARLPDGRLRFANMRNSFLSFANLRRAELIGADLTEADLTGAKLYGASLNRAQLSAADLTEAGLSEANFDGADLSVAHLEKADLSEARLSGVDLVGAQLNGADLNGANLDGADLSGANLTEAKLTEADLNGAGFISADLRYADFRYCRHLNPKKLMLSRNYDQAYYDDDVAKVLLGLSHDQNRKHELDLSEQQKMEHQQKESRR